MSSSESKKLTSDIDETETNYKILIEQCSLANNYTKETLLLLLKSNNNDIADCIFDLEDGTVKNKITQNDTEKDIDWENKLNSSNFDSKIIRKLLDERDKLMFNTN